MSDEVRRRDAHQRRPSAVDPLVERLIDIERRRIWVAIESWTEIAHRLDDEGRLVTIEGAEFKPLGPFFNELRAIVFPPDEYVLDEASTGDAP